MERCSDCTAWEENIYWTHFQFIHFCQFLKGDFTTQLAIPEKFAHKLRKKLPRNMTIKGPSGLAWNVELAASDDALFFRHGWEDFAKDHSLEENDILMFRYNGESCFDVLIFDQYSLCEKEASYFKRKCQHKEISKGCGRKRKLQDLPDEVAVTPSRQNHKNNLVDPLEAEALTEVPACPQTSPQTQAGLNGKVHRKSNLIKSAKKKGIAVRTLKKIKDSDAKQVSMSKSPGRYPVYVSHRRTVTKEEQDAALNLAQSAAMSGNFLVVMRPSHVYKRFYLSIPPDWAAEHFGQGNQDVILRYRGGNWHCRYNLSARGTGGLSSGWKNFAVQNNLEEYDVCLFALGDKINNIPVLDVTIFRVVEDITPITLATTST